MRKAPVAKSRMLLMIKENRVLLPAAGRESVSA